MRIQNPTMASNLAAYCDLLLQSIRASGLNYTSQETPYSIYVTLCKSFTKTGSIQNQDSKLVPELCTRNQNHGLAKLKEENEILLKDQKNMEEAFDNLKNCYNDAIEENAQNKKVIENLEAVSEEKATRIKFLEFNLFQTVSMLSFELQN